jgi:hypothetical protein
MTFNTIDAAGNQDGATLDFEFDIDQHSNPLNIAHLRISLTKPGGNVSLEFRLCAVDASQLTNNLYVMMAHPDL